MNIPEDEDDGYDYGDVGPYPRKTNKIADGVVVRLLRNVERFPEFICDAGAIGTVVESKSDFLRVKMDQHIPGAEEWDNCIIWVHPEDGEIDGDLEVVT